MGPQGILFLFLQLCYHSKGITVVFVVVSIVVVFIGHLSRLLSGNTPDWRLELPRGGLKSLERNDTDARDGAFVGRRAPPATSCRVACSHAGQVVSPVAM